MELKTETSTLEVGKNIFQLFRNDVHVCMTTEEICHAFGPGDSPSSTTGSLEQGLSVPMSLVDTHVRRQTQRFMCPSVFWNTEPVFADWLQLGHCVRALEESKVC